MIIAQVNTTCRKGSTGKICVAISELLSEQNIENKIFFTNGNSEFPAGRKYASAFYIKLQAFKSRIFGNWGFNSKSATRRLIRELNQCGVDVIHLHNIHGHDCNLDMLFRYIKQRKLKVFWTFHDCWAFVGSCTHYMMAKCDEWKKECKACPQWRTNSWFFDRNSELLSRKKRLMAGIDMTIITPSQWLADQVKQSFLKDYPVKVINNGIDLDVFQPKESCFRRKYNCENKKIVLGVAFGWGVRKGLDVFIALSRRLTEDYQLLLVGTDKTIDRQLPENIISIHRTQNQQELAEIYTAADVFVNPTREDNFPTVNIEALACGTSVVTFDTGGSPEILDETCGMVVPCDDVDALEKAIQYVCEEKPFSQKACLVRAKHFDKNDKFQEYVDLYCEMMKREES